MSAIQPGGRFGVLDINERDCAITGFREKAVEDGAWINAGFMVMEPEVFDFIENDTTIFELAPLESMSAEGKLGGLPAPRILGVHGYHARQERV